MDNPDTLGQAGNFSQYVARHEDRHSILVSQLPQELANLNDPAGLDRWQAHPKKVTWDGGGGLLPNPTSEHYPAKGACRGWNTHPASCVQCSPGPTFWGARCKRRATSRFSTTVNSDSCAESPPDTQPIPWFRLPMRTLVLSTFA